jgi:hypothetical protein
MERGIRYRGFLLTWSEPPIDAGWRLNVKTHDPKLSAEFGNTQTIIACTLEDADEMARQFIDSLLGHAA